MPAFYYIAIDASGKEQKGVIEADGEKHARQLLRDKSFIPVQVRLGHSKNNIAKEKNLSTLFTARRLSSKELALFTRQVATLLAAGMPVEEALLAVAEQTEKARIKSLILSVRSKVMEGYALAAAFRDHPDAFAELFCATVAAGEKTGHLDKVLMRLADYTEQQWNAQQKLRTALIYPIMIIFVAVGIVGFLLEYVVPKMIAVYSHLNQELPLMTQILLNVSAFLKSYGLYIVILLIAAIVFFRQAFKRNELVRLHTHKIMLRLPLFGYALKTSDTARFARTLAILSGAGVSVLEAMHISAKLMTTIPIKHAIDIAVHRVREGGAIHLALKQTGFFSPMSVHMVASGEASGQLESMLERVAVHQENEITRLIDVGLALFEPVIILVMGMVVLFIVLAVMLPIFNLNEFTR